jgi:hypothetical protein
MKNRILWALVGLNVLLAVTLVMRWSSDNTAVAQAARRPADYILVPGEVNGGASAVIYMVDTSNGLLGAMAYDDAMHVLNTMPPLDLNRVFEATGAGATGGAGNPPGPNGRIPPPGPGAGAGRK